METAEAALDPMGVKVGSRLKTIVLSRFGLISDRVLPIE
jgi:hypothetical protein